FQIEMRGQRGEIVGIVIHVVTGCDLARTTMPTPIMGDDPEAAIEEEQHLAVPVIGRQRPAMAEYDGLARAPILVEDRGAVFGGDGRHGSSLLEIKSRCVDGFSKALLHAGALSVSPLSSVCDCRDQAASLSAAVPVVQIGAY